MPSGSASNEAAAAAFEPLRPTLIRVAYRMLGSVADAEDIVQDAFLRWLDLDRDAVREPAAFLRKAVTHLCLDRLKSRRRERETYVGTWLPEPVVETEEEQDDVTLPLLMALERLSPLERAAFLLHDVFGLDFEEVAHTIERDAAACRQLASRARAHVRADSQRYSMPRERSLEMAQAFFAASRDGELERLRALLSADVTLYADGGGKVPTRKTPAFGIADVMRMYEAFAAIYDETRSRLVRYGYINGLPGFITIERGDILQTTALDVANGRIVAIYIVRNAEKLKHIREAAH